MRRSGVSCRCYYIDVRELPGVLKDINTYVIILILKPAIPRDKPRLSANVKLADRSERFMGTVSL